MKHISFKEGNKRIWFYFENKRLEEKVARIKYYFNTELDFRGGYYSAKYTGHLSNDEYLNDEYLDLDRTLDELNSNV